MKADNAKQMISVMSSVSHVPVREVARRLDRTSQWLYGKSKTGKFTFAEWDAICKTLGFHIEIKLTQPSTETEITWEGGVQE